MSAFLGEFIGTALLILLGGGVVANVVLKDTKGNNSGWIVITFGWGMAVFVGVYASNHLGGSGHLNPAVSIALAAFNKFDSGLLATYIGAQMAGAMAGAFLVWLIYKPHFDASTDADGKMAVFCTAPAIRKPVFNFISECIGTFVLLFGALCISKPSGSMGALDALPVAFLVLAIGLSLGGPTGYAINPARDLGPRIVHFILPIAGKRNSDWSYAWIPVAGPIAGGLLAAAVYSAVIS
ncbi:MAG: aquaporin family protein [Sphingobacteriales bacterium]|jgi:glycerol uptake facilitator protein|nr:aquaporin family protein [Sphingobacteriales bacterium]NCT75536.1 aquaporin family protein [Chitinophagaceae bacterium]OJW30659.1 MAG: aquaporin [Sphingobacteriales bacterium 46-32]